MRVSLLAIPLAFAILDSTACSPRDDVEPSPHTYQMGERVRLGHLVYTIFDRQWIPQIGEGVDARIPQNRFYRIRFTVLNSGGASLTIPTISLVDDADTTYPETANGEGVQDFVGPMRQAASAETISGNLLFDVQPKHYKLKLSDEDGKTFAMVELPLDFDTDQPDVTTPLDSIRSDPTSKKK